MIFFDSVGCHIKAVNWKVPFLLHNLKGHSVKVVVLAY